MGVSFSFYICSMYSVSLQILLLTCMKYILNIVLEVVFVIEYIMQVYRIS